MVLSGEKILEETRLMKKDVETGRYTRDELSVRHQFLFCNLLHLFDMIIENSFNYMPMVATLCEKLNSVKKIDETDPTYLKAQKQVDTLLYNKYVSHVLNDPELDELVNKDNIE